MSNWDRLRAALRREKRDIGAALSEFETKANATLDDKERELKASPAEKMAMEQARAQELDDQFQALRRQIGGEPKK